MSTSGIGLVYNVLVVVLGDCAGIHVQCTHQ